MENVMLNLMLIYNICFGSLRELFFFNYSRDDRVVHSDFSMGGDLSPPIGVGL